MKYVLEKEIVYDEDLATVITSLIPERLKISSTSKMTDAGMLKDYSIDVSINNQTSQTMKA